MTSTISFRKLLAVFVGVFLFAVVQGCGGGGQRSRNTGGGGGGGTTGAASVTIQLKDANTGASSNTATAGAPLAAEATVKDASGNAAANVVVTFSTANAVATLSPASGTALTDSRGVARILIQAGASSGADTLTASAAVGSSTAQATIGFQAATPNVSLSSLLISPTTLSAGGTAGVTVRVVDSSGAAFLTPVEVAFTSVCASQGKATIGSPATTVNGVASTSYVDQGCANTDTVTATLSLNSSNLAGSIIVLPASVGSIQFVSATPTVIAIRGTGGVEAATVKFKVLGTTGIPVSNAAVTFELNTVVGGLQISPLIASSGVDGIVQTTVQAGTIATPVRVTARLASNTTISTQSEQLTVTTAIPHQNGFSISASTLNIEGLDLDGTATTLTARLSDRFGNPAPDGTAVTFRTERGISAASPASCTTLSGVCSVVLRSSGNRNVLTNGRLRVLATAIGEESYTDTNGNGVFDSGEGFTDLSEAFLDANENGSYDAAAEEFVDFDADGAFDAPDGAFNGVLRFVGATGPATLHVRSSLDIVLSGSNPLLNADINDAALFPAPAGSPANSNPDITSPIPSSVDVECGTSKTASFQVRLTDQNGQILPAGTTISFAADNAGKLLSSPASFVVPNTSSTLIPIYNVTVGSSGSLPTCTVNNRAGTFVIRVKTPSGLETIFTRTISDAP